MKVKFRMVDFLKFVMTNYLEFEYVTNICTQEEYSPRSILTNNEEIPNNDDEPHGFEVIMLKLFPYYMLV